MTSPAQEYILRQRFSMKVTEASKGVKSKHITFELHNKIIERLELLKENPHLKRTDQDRQIMRRYSVEVSTLEGRTINYLPLPLQAQFRKEE